MYKQIETAKEFASLFAHSADKQAFERLIDEMELQVFCVNKDMECAHKRIGELAAENYDAVVSAQAGYGRYFCYITPLCISKQMASHVESHLRKACGGKASVLWQTIHEYELMDYLSTKNLSAQQIYEELSDYFGPLPFSERTFRMYR
ncbi:MAG: hypothetical protein J6T80_07215 [Paludibacteraceae bacterium]|nr:hypothetical protein [Paludibacteraceae bacterium]